MTTYVVVYGFGRYLVTKKVTDGGGDSSYTVVAECDDLAKANAIAAALS